MSESKPMTGNVNEDAILYDDHTVNYPARRRAWVELARRGRIVIRDDPDGPVPCKFGHDDCVTNES